MSKVTSLRGEEVDFDLLRMKNSIGDVPITDDVENRERFVNAKRRRGSKRKIDEMITRQNAEANYKRDVKKTSSPTTKTGDAKSTKAKDDEDRTVNADNAKPDDDMESDDLDTTKTNKRKVMK